MKKVEQHHLETLYNQIEILKGQMAISQDEIEKSVPDFIYNTVTDPLIYKLISEYMQYKIDQEATDIEKATVAKNVFLMILSSISISRVQDKILLNEDSVEFILYYFYLLGVVE